MRANRPRRRSARKFFIAVYQIVLGIVVVVMVIVIVAVVVVVAVIVIVAVVIVVVDFVSNKSWV